MRPLRAVAGTVLIGVGLTTVGIASAGQSPAPGTGSAVVTIELPQLTISDPGAGARSVQLPTLTATALTDTGVLGSLALDGGSLLGAALPGWTVDSATGSQSTDHDVPLSAAGVTADVDLLGYGVSGSGQSAAATLGSLTGTVAASPVGLHVGLGQHGVAATVDATSSNGLAELTVDGLDLHLGDILPSDVLDALPLNGLVDIVDGLGLPLPAGATDVRSQLQQLAADLTNIENTSTQLVDAQNQLAADLLNVPSTAAAQQTLTDAQTTLTDDLAKLHSAEQTLGTDTAVMQSLQQQVTTLSAAVASAQQQLDAAQTSVTTLTGQVNTLMAEIASDPFDAVSLTAQLATVQQQLTDAQAEVTSDQAALDAAQAALMPVQQQLSAATSTVTADQSTVDTLQQTVTADQAAVTAAQQALDALVAQISGDQTVADATALVDQLTTTLTGLLDTANTDVAALPDLSQLRAQLVSTLTAAPLLDVGTIGATVSSTATDDQGSGAVTCTVTGASVLGQTIPAGDCDGLVARYAQIAAALSGALTQLPLTTAVSPSLSGLAVSSTGGPAATGDSTTAAAAGLTPLHLVLPSATLGSLTDPAVSSLAAMLAPTQQSLASLGLPATTDALSGSLGSLSTALAALPNGAGLAGLQTIGVDASLPGLSASALRYRLPPASPPLAGTTGSTPPATGGSTPPATGGSTPPATGGVPPVSASPGAPPTVPVTSGGEDGGAVPPSSDPPRSVVRPPVAPPMAPVRVVEHAPTLPFTGDNAAVEIAAGLVIALVGGHLLLAGRRPRPTAR